MPSEHKVKVGDAISLYWITDRTWYDGKVESIDADSGACEVLYDDGERETLNLENEKFRIKDRKGEELKDLVEASDGDLSKQLKHIADVLRDCADRLPPEGCSSNREAWWAAWHSDINSAVDTGNVIKLVKATHDFGGQLRQCVATPWWTTEAGSWRNRLLSVKTCEGLVNSLEELRIKGVNWTRARQLFIASSSSSE